jgi:hypothetical protein
MNAFWGDDTWRGVAYDKNLGLFGEMEEKVSNRRFAEEFRRRLKEVATFKRVPEPLAMRNSKGSTFTICFSLRKKTQPRIS